MDYYVLINGNPVGPVERTKVSEMVQAGSLTSNDLCCPVGDKEWSPITVHFPLSSGVRTKLPEGTNTRPISIPDARLSS